MKEIEEIKADIKDIRVNHLQHIETSICSMQDDIGDIKTDLADIHTKVSVLEEMKEMLQENFTKLVQALIVVTLASLGIQTAM